MRKDMKMKGYILTLLLGLAAAYACTREELTPDAAVVEHGSGNLVPFTAEAGATRTRIAVGESTTNIVFSAGDQLLVTCSGIIDKSILRIQSGAGESSAVFSGNLLLKEGKTEADLAGKRLIAVLVPEKGLDTGLFTLEPDTKKLTVDFSGGSIDSDLEALVNRTALYEGETTYEARKFEFELSTSYVRMKVTVPKEESDLARDYTVSVTYDWHMCAQAYHSQYGGWECRGWNSTVTGTFHASSATGGTLYMAVMAGSGQRILDDSPYYDEVDFSIQMENVYKGYGLTGGAISKAVVAPGRGYTKSVTLKELDNEDVLLGQPESVRRKILQVYHADLNSNGSLSKYEAAQLKSCKMYGNEDLTNATFYQYFTGMTVFEDETLVSCQNMTKVVLPKHITEIGNRALESCTKLTGIIIPFSVTGIGNYAFNNCTSLSRIVIPSGVTTIGDCAFRYCASLTEVVFDSSSLVASIGSAAFENCKSLEAISIPSRVMAISNKTFDGCTSLSSVSIPVRVTSIGERAFAACAALTSVRVPARVTSIGANAFIGASSLATVILPTSGIKTIAEGTFNGCTALANIALPGDLEIIETAAFKECSSLVNITIPEKVTSIGYEAFYNCNSLTSVYLYPPTPPAIVYHTFYGCPNATFYVVDKEAYWPAHATWSQWYWSRIVQM